MKSQSVRRSQPQPAILPEQSGALTKVKPRRTSGDNGFDAPGNASPIGQKTITKSGAGPQVASADRFASLIADKTPFSATGTLEQFAYSGGSLYGTETVAFTPLADGRLVAEDLRSEYVKSSGEDVILQPDEHGGYTGLTARGDEWTLSPADARGTRVLALSPQDREGVISKYTLHIPDPAQDLALWHGTTVMLEESSISDDATGHLAVKLDTSGDHLAITLSTGERFELSHRSEQGGFADHPGTYDAKATAAYSPKDDTYRISVSTDDGTFDKTIGPVHGRANEAAGETEMLAFVSRPGRSLEAQTMRATLSKAGDGRTVLRLSETSDHRPALLTFDKPRSRRSSASGAGRDGVTARLSAPDATGARTVKVKTRHGVESLIRLEPYDGAAAVARFAGRTGKIEIATPDGTDRYGHPSQYLAPNTITLRFAAGHPGSDRLDVELELDGKKTDDLVMHPTEWGGFTINYQHQRLWITPQKDGTFTAGAEWSLGQMERGTFSLD